jgi:hypothetical protein
MSNRESSAHTPPPAPWPPPAEAPYPRRLVCRWASFVSHPPPSGCALFEPVAPRSCRTWRVRVASGGFHPGSSRTRPLFAGRRQWLHPCACADTPRAASRCRRDGQAWSMPPAVLSAPVLLFARVSLIRLWSSVSPPSFPRTCPCSGASFPPRGPLGWFPRFLGTTKHSDFLPPLPRHFVSFAQRYRRRALGFVPAAARRNNCGPGICLPDSPTPDSLAEATGPPRFLGDPTMNVPCSSTPAGPRRSATTALRCCLPPN